MDERIDPSIVETVANVETVAVQSMTLSSSSSSALVDDGRFVPGTLLGGRYRIIGGASHEVRQ